MGRLICAILYVVQFPPKYVCCDLARDTFFLPPQISCVSSSTELADRVRFKSYFQLLPSEADIAPAYFGVIRQYDWRHVALIVQNENLFTVVSFENRTAEFIEHE